MKAQGISQAQAPPPIPKSPVAEECFELPPEQDYDQDYAPYFS